MSTEIAIPPLESKIQQAVSESKITQAYLRDLPWKNTAVQFKIDDLVHNPATADTITELLENKVDGLHGLGSPHLLSMLRHGIVPTSEHQQLGIIALGRENHSQPHRRKAVHVVSWLFAGETVRYAEYRVQGGRKRGDSDFVTLENAQQFAEIDTSYLDEIKDDPNRSCVVDHILGSVWEARTLLEKIESGRLEGTAFELISDPFPIVAGISTETIDTNRLRGEETVIEGDVSIYGRVSALAITALYVPETQLSRVYDAVLTEAPSTNIALLCLEDLRALT